MLKKSLDRRTGELGEIVVDARDEWGGGGGRTSRASLQRRAMTGAE